MTLADIIFSAALGLGFAALLLAWAELVRWHDSRNEDLT